jgi:type III restriction enzyme
VKIRFKRQPFQLEAVRSVVDCFAGQPHAVAARRFGPGGGRERKTGRMAMDGSAGDAGDIVLRNEAVRLSDEDLLRNIRAVQRRNGLDVSERLAGRYNLTVEMETGTGKTYTYIRTMFELYRTYGWSRFIVVVPSVAIREGVLKTFRMTEDHFMAEYGMKARYFVYNSKQLHQIGRFAGDAGLNVMIINAQAFNARGRDARRIFMELDDFGSRRPIDVLAGARPILIIDEPQSVEGPRTRESLRAFQPLFTLRYSATHREDYNKVYRLDALDAYNLKLVKKISVKGISFRGTGGADGYLYLEGVETGAGRAPAARLEFEAKTKAGLVRRTRLVRAGDDLHELSGGLAQYKGYRVAEINGRDGSIHFVNGAQLSAGDVRGDAGEPHLRRIQIRETIRSHFEKERALYPLGIKVLSLFFIDEVAKYRQYGPDGAERNGVYADLFEEEYAALLAEELAKSADGDPYAEYLRRIEVKETHKGYFSIDRKSNRYVDPKPSARESDSDDAGAYNLIMRDKERLLGLAEPVRFIFSHSALKEGWDNPNVFQICTLKHSDSAIKKRQEVGRGLRLCVNQDGERIDAGVPGVDVHEINVLTVIASESYEQFARQLQGEIAEALAGRPGAAERVSFLERVAENGRIRRADGSPDDDELHRREFLKLWSRIHRRAARTARFDSAELVRKCVEALDRELKVPAVQYTVRHGEMRRIGSREQLEAGEAFRARDVREEAAEWRPRSGAKMDLIGRLAAETRLARKTVAAILTGIREETFRQFRLNPEEFVLRAARLINGRMTASVVAAVTWDARNGRFEADVFTAGALAGRTGDDAVPAAPEPDDGGEIVVYEKLPRGFAIPTPLGDHRPDRAVVVREGDGKHIYFIAETADGLESLEFGETDREKIGRARRHLAMPGGGRLKVEAADSYGKLLGILKPS